MLLTPIVGKKAANILLTNLQELGNPAYLLKILSEEELAIHIGTAAARKLTAALQLGRSLSVSPTWQTVSSPESAYSFLVSDVRPRQECAQAIYMNAKHQVLATKTLNIGLTDETLVDFKELLRWAVMFNASHVIFAHNHPSGDTEPSYEDLELTKRMIEVCNLVSINLLDSIVLGEGHFVSIRKLYPNYWATQSV